jgi:hypothetical protein
MIDCHARLQAPKPAHARMTAAAPDVTVEATEETVKIQAERLGEHRAMNTLRPKQYQVERHQPQKASHAGFEKYAD